MISTRQLGLSIGGKTLLAGLDLDFSLGERWAIVGQSGSGKTLLTKLLQGFMQPTMGEISIGNQRMGPSPSNWQAARLQMGIVFQEPALLDELPVWENIGLRLLETGTNPHTVQEEVQAALASVGLQSEVATLYPAALSGGMQKRVAFARAVLHQPKILFADEPAAGLDPQNATRMDELMLQLASRPNRLSILVTHDPISVQAFASHVLMLEKGLLHFKGPVAEFLACPTPSIVAFLKRHLQHSS